MRREEKRRGKMLLGWRAKSGCLGGGNEVFMKKLGYEGLFNLKIPGKTQRAPREILDYKLDYIKK